MTLIIRRGREARAGRVSAIIPDHRSIESCKQRADWATDPANCLAQ